MIFFVVLIISCSNRLMHSVLSSGSGTAVDIFVVFSHIFSKLVTRIGYLEWFMQLQ